ncbi:sulfate ABC transporter permease subunit CysT [Aminipila butyrica]|uniref:Sulfate transport system permease protein CysT n=1 Tax=Aminipila butyrica TaxID=433296 RepID=A0A858C095_9FIRM|nr:sulfate ABC transporter permease subunit CysT [Aminipila butyrica]QIB70474.1 sulfate ABC transporter permease subunit CysT [Aminipila butyrica]
MLSLKNKRKRNNTVIPGFGLSMGITITMLSLIVLIPLCSVLLTLSDTTFAGFWQNITDEQTMATYKVSFSCALIAAVINVSFGILLAWILTRYQFPLKSLLDGLIELPFALPTAVAGIALTTLYSDKGWIGALFDKIDVKISYTTIGITIAMVFIGIPFVVRSIQPVLEKLDPQFEEAATVLGASRFRIFCKVILPEILPAALTGFGLAFARAIGEYGSVVFIAGNIPYKTQITPLIIMSKLEQFNYAAATSIALVMILFAFVILFGINVLQAAINKVARGS